MFTKKQERLLENFADKSDQLFNLGVISTDSFTGEIGEYIICKYFNLQKTNRVTQAVDGISSKGDRYQIKAKVVSKSNFNYNIKNLNTDLFDILAIIYFDKFYNPLKIVVLSSDKIKDREIKISNSNILTFKNIEGNEIKVPVKIKNAINEFAEAYNSLEENQIIRSRHIVGDIGEFYACKKLDLVQSINKNEKGIDAKHENGLTFEIKTRRVYESGRRISETRRLNNLEGKSADYLVVVTLDRTFRCSGMWLIPMQNIINPKSANLKIVNSTYETLNLIPSQIPWLETGDIFIGFNHKQRRTNTQKLKKVAKPNIKKVTEFNNNNSNIIGLDNSYGYIILVLLIVVILIFIS
ncbi:hypothetical protein NU10_03190 [Flavobacterium dauae]|uniref:DUF6998 domain-containing protein n=1 Tax=Flavobacterium dauae TaxID=1563479 RepID=UPI00101B4219|nr:hypothetical protein [Flavobacterium dauae]WLD24418.1 hypothetical protein NU10_03190 [Flavobacterium dauae]